MSPRAAPPVEIRVAGRLDDAALRRVADAFGAVQASETVLVGPVADQAQLQALVALLEALGCDVLEVRRLTRRQTDRAGA